MAKYKIIRDEYKIDFNHLEGKISEVREYLNELANEYGEDAELDFVYGYEGIEDLAIHFCREETDKERNRRLTKARKEREKNKAAKVRYEEKERVEFARLLKKYGED